MRIRIRLRLVYAAKSVRWTYAIPRITPGSYGCYYDHWFCPTMDTTSTASHVQGNKNGGRRDEEFHASTDPEKENGVS